MALSKPIGLFDAQPSGGPRNNKTFFEKKNDLLRRQSVLDILQMPCQTCEEDCMWALVNKLENVVETILEMRRKRFAGPPCMRFRYSKYLAQVEIC